MEGSASPLAEELGCSGGLVDKEEAAEGELDVRGREHG